MSNIVLIPQEFPTVKERDKIVDLYKHLRLAGLKQDPEAFSATYETEAEFPHEKWLARIENPQARTFIALDDGETVPSTGNALTALLSSEWLGTVTIVGPRLAFSSEIDLSAPWRVFEEGDRYTTPQADDRNVVAVYMIAGMFVLPASRGMGNGRRLVEEAIRHTRGASPATEQTLLVLLVEANNEAARKLYAAEFINTLTNVVYVIYAIYGLYHLWQKPNVGFLRTVPYLGLMAVGLCSALFHISLNYHTQMLDDLSMMFTTTPVLHRVMTASASPGVTLIVGIVLGSTLLALVIYHLKTDELLLHSLFFVGSVTVIGVFTMRLINARTRAGSEARRQIWGMVRFGAGNILISRHADSETPAKILRRYIQFGILALDG
ncbi:hypothetical protein KXV31_001570 [Aspergillus fumigatus]|nr:hypothetical protein KXX01_006698 [Aspergillus fumigatus]KAH2019564.1 hypothetical protein KXV45_003789 [Aspergillus fumigatus]KAH2030554.1 hypothetical protein KXV65_003322 [Aspergillus fumigatus]KAH2267092.1 hypothetical protein KXW26_003492 [Aspergillus fumigatus]KAH2306061.1 hypothetical protein KXW82_003652 [Aspergillus fumigatus]